MKKAKIIVLIFILPVFSFIAGYRLKLPANSETFYTELPVKKASITRNSDAGIDDSRRNAITEAVNNASPAVVGINVLTVERYRSPLMNDPFFRYFFPDETYEKEAQSLGSGFIISEDGYIVTNEHVIENFRQISVTLTDGRKFSAKHIGSDFLTDIALLKIEGNNFPTVPLGNSEDILIGEWVIALGNPFGLFDYNNKPTVTVGVISAVNINFGITHADRVYQNMIQTDASINPGNSGGPLLNSRGEVIGMNAFIFTGSNTSQGSIGVGFAIPINKVKEITTELRQYGEVQRNVETGVYGRDISVYMARALNLKEARGVYVTALDRGGPGDNAGLQKGDIILEVNGIPVKNREHVSKIILEQDLRPGDTMNLKVLRKGKTINIDLVLGKSK